LLPTVNCITRAKKQGHRSDELLAILPLVGKFFGLARGKRHFKSKKEEARRKKQEGRSKKAVDRKQLTGKLLAEGIFFPSPTLPLSHSPLSPSPTLPISHSLPLSLSHFLHLPIPDSTLSFGPGILF
jgi:hypothetical protein